MDLESIREQFTNIIFSKQHINFLNVIATLITIASVIPPIFNFVKRLKKHRTLVDLTTTTQNLKEFKEFMKNILDIFSVFWVFISILIISFVSLCTIHFKSFLQVYAPLHNICVISLLIMSALLLVHILNNKSEWRYIDILLYTLFFTCSISFLIGNYLTYNNIILQFGVVISACLAVATFKTNVSHNIIVYDDNIFWKIVAYIRYFYVLFVFCLWLIQEEPLYWDSAIIFWLCATSSHCLYCLCIPLNPSGDLLKYIETEDCNYTSTSMVKYTQSGFIEFNLETGELMSLNSKQLRLIRYSVYNEIGNYDTKKKYCCELYDGKEKYYFDKKKIISQNWMRLTTYSQSRTDILIIPKERIKYMTDCLSVTSFSEKTES